MDNSVREGSEGMWHVLLESSGRMDYVVCMRGKSMN